MRNPASLATEADARAIARQCMRNLERVRTAAQCGYFYCQGVFPGEAIRDWTDDDQTALCPLCGIDSVLPDVTDADTLRSLHHYRFKATFRLTEHGWQKVQTMGPVES